MPYTKVGYDDFFVLGENCMKKLEECMDYELSTSEIMQSKYARICIKY